MSLAYDAAEREVRALRSRVQWADEQAAEAKAGADRAQKQAQALRRQLEDAEAELARWSPRKETA